MKIKRLPRLLMVVSSICLLSFACEVSGGTPGASNAEPFEQELFDEGPTSEPDTTRSNPVPAGSQGGAEGMSFLVTDVTRPADSLVASADDFNPAPGANQEYVLVSVEITCEAEYDQRCAVETFGFKLVGANGFVYPFSFGVSGLEDMVTDREFFGGASFSAVVPFLVDQGESELILIYESFIDFPLFMALPEGAE